MPVAKKVPTRPVQTKPSSSEPKNVDAAKQKTCPKPVYSAEVIEISSDSDEETGLGVTAPQSQVKRLERESTRCKDQAGRLQEENVRLHEEVQNFQQKSTVANNMIVDLQDRIKQLELDFQEQEQELEAQIRETKAHEELVAKYNETQQENAMLKDASKRGNDKLMLELEDHISCEICVSKLWKPYILPGCGHTFCQDCLEDWFNTTLRQHMEVFPYYDPTPVIPAVIRQQMRSPEPRVQAGARAQAHALLSQHQQPEPWYSCPTCREQVQRKPVEDFVLKSLVRTIAGATGQSSPKRQPALRRAGAAQEDPWYAFFESVEI